MALSASRAAFASRSAVKTLLGKHATPIQIQAAGMKATFGEKYPYPKPFPYEKRRYTIFDELMEDTRKRFNENSKIIVIEGNVGVGKNDFAKRIANNFDLKYIPAVNEEDIFCRRNNFDIRTVDDCLPENAKSYTLRSLFHDPNPTRGKAILLQYQFYFERYVSYYHKALLHLLSTGQGVVIVRSPWSDAVFADVLRQMGWITKPGYEWYKDTVVKFSICYFLKPHITLYLDAPVDVCMQRAKAKGGYEVDGANFTPDFLSLIEKNYKEKYLPSIRERTQVLEIDWAKVGDDLDMDVITDEVADLNLDNCDSDWNELSRNHFGQLRMDFQNKYGRYYGYANPTTPLHLKEIQYTEPERHLREQVIDQHPAMKWRGGFSKELGDKVPRFNFF